MEASIEEIVDGLPSTKASEVNTTRKRKTSFRRSKLLGRISPGGLALFVVAITVTAVLGGYFYSKMYVEMDGDVDVSGRTLTSVFSFDDTPIEGGLLTVPLDLTSITNGDVKMYEHSISNEDMGDWLVTITCSLEEITNPLDPYYGIFFECQPNGFITHPTETVPLKFWFNASHEYMDPVLYGGDPTLTVSVNITIESVIPPNAKDDSMTYHAGLCSYFDIPVLNNDEDFSGAGLEIVDTDWVGASDGMELIVIGTFPNQQIEVNLCNGKTGTHTFTYTVEDGNGITDTATVTIFGD